MMSDTNNNDQSSVSAFDGNEEQNSSTDRIAATLQEIEATAREVKHIQEAIDAMRKAERVLETSEEENELLLLCKKDELLRKKDELLRKKDELRDKKDELYDKKHELYYKENELLRKKDKLRDKKDELLKDLKYGKYFAKADDIFPRNNLVLVQRPGFQGAADIMMRERAPGADDDNNGDFNPYGTLIESLEKHLSENSNDPDNSVADINSIAASDFSDALTEDDRTLEVSVGTPRKNQDFVERSASKTSAGGNKKQAPPNLKLSIIPGTEGHRGYQAPDGPSCIPWWAPVCHWAIGKVDAVDQLCEKIEKEKDPKERREMEDRLRRALLLLATGTAGKQGGMKDVSQNILYVPNPHAEYYDTGYNWVIIPIMTLEQILAWKGERYEVAIFTGENGRDMEKKEKEINNHFHDGPTTHSAVEAEEILFSRLEPEDIRVCSKDDLDKVTDVLTHFFKAFADLHTRSYNDEGEPQKNVSPRKWSIIDLADEVKRTFETAIIKKGGDPNKDTKVKSVEQSKRGLEALIKEILKKPSGNNEDPPGGVRVPKRPDRNTFDGKHVFKAVVGQAYPPDPLFVAGKGTNNLGRQWDIRFMSGCTDKSDSDSSSDMTPHMVFTGLEIAVATPDQLRPSCQAVTTDNDDYDDAVSDVSVDEYFTGLNVAVVTAEN